MVCGKTMIEDKLQNWGLGEIVAKSLGKTVILGKEQNEKRLSFQKAKMEYNGSSWDSSLSKGGNLRLLEDEAIQFVCLGKNIKGRGTQAGVVYNSCWTCGSRDHLRRDCPWVAQEGQAPVVSSTRGCWGCGFTGHQKHDCPLMAGGVQAKTPTVAPQRGHGRGRG
ncbi:hypothetical protein V6N12_050489 [Hibiscus sabdariffa]|uniref:CCHC-type domain-containing protein n=1 Tax=Hibiscus sabdariffa TaxID=183260 RepID=A0ABR2GCJ2_9ROSI